MLSDRIIPDELLLSRARFRFIRFVKCKRYLGYNKICKFVLGLFIKLCQLFLGRVNDLSSKMPPTAKRKLPKNEAVIKEIRTRTEKFRGLGV